MRNENSVEDRPIAVYTDMDDTDPTLGIELLENAGFAVRVLGTRDAAAIVAGAQDATVLLPGYAPVTRDIIEALPELRIIACMSVGVDEIDIDAATEHGVWVTNVPASATEEVAGHALALALHSLRQLRFYTESANPDRWNERAPVAARRLSELRLGIVGLGRIGRELARLAKPIFGHILGYDPLLPQTSDTDATLAELGVERVDLDVVRGSADVLSLHLPLTPDTDRMVNAEFLAHMPRGSVIINVSRGRLIDSQALAAALDVGHLSGAGLDVLDVEPPPADHPLLGRDDVVLTPHIAYYSSRTEIEYVRVQAHNVVTWADTGQPDTPVNRPGHSV